MIPKRVAAFWFVVLLGASILIFRSGAANSSWLVAGVGYLCGLLSFGALLELLKRGKPVDHPATAMREIEREARGLGVSLEQLATIPPETMQVIEAFSRVMEDAPGQVQPESMLPYPKPVIEGALRTALSTLSDAGSQRGLRLALSVLDTFIPDDQVPEDPDERAMEYVRLIGRRARTDRTE